MNNETIKIWGDGNDVRDYIHIQDAIAAILKVIDYDGNEKNIQCWYRRRLFNK